MIKVYPVKIEAYDEEKETVVFTIEAFDSFCAEVTMKQEITNESIENVTAALRRAVQMLELNSKFKHENGGQE
jgi:hypothetical protein